MVNPNDITACILAGGKSSRMGTDKGLLLLNQKPLIQHIIDAIPNSIINQIIIANSDSYSPFSIPVYSDIIPDCGPLGGIFTALKHAKTDWILLLSCDIPLINSSIIENLMHTQTDKKGIVYASNQKLHPLCGFYHVSILSEVETRLIAGELKMQELCHTIPVFAVDLPQQWANNFKNINTPTDYNTLQHEYA